MDGETAAGAKRRIAFCTLGCKVNQYETQALRERMAGLGWIVAGGSERADVYVINTCTVTGTSDSKSRQFIRRAKRLNPDGLVAVMGCYAQLNTETVADMPEVDIILGSTDKNRLPELIEARIGGGARVSATRDFEAGARYEEMGTVTAMASRTRAYVKIEDGCDRRCAYCVIPLARGPVRSRHPDEIVREARALIAAGYKELVLTGVNMALYGTDFRDAPAGSGLPDPREADGLYFIVNLLNGLDGDFRIRLGSLEPTVTDAARVKSLLGFKRLCPALHLSAQSGSTRVLGAMRRGYTREDYETLVRALRAFDAGYAVSTDFIVGFPGETDEDFRESLALAEETGFSHIHVFRYSERAGTEAAGRAGQISASVKNRRSAILTAAGEHSARAFLERNAGGVRTVLPERADARTGMVEGLSENDIRVRFPGGEACVGRFAAVRLLSVGEDGIMTGERE